MYEYSGDSLKNLNRAKLHLPYFMTWTEMQTSSTDLSNSQTLTL